MSDKFGLLRHWRLGLLALLAALYAPTMVGVVRVWWKYTYAGHVLFVPVFAALMLWTVRSELRAAAGRGHPAGLFVVAGGLGLLLLGWGTGSLALQGVSLVATAAGFVLWGWGAGCLRKAAFPIAYLVFIVPPPRALIAAVTETLQLFAANFAVASVRLFDVPVHQAGVMLELPSTRLEVAEICNGLRFLFALLVMTGAFAYITQRGIVRQAVLIASAVPIAVLANATRVAVIVLGVHFVGPELASGTVHHLIGKAVWGLTLIPLLALGFALSRYPGRSRSRRHSLDVPTERGQPA